MILNVYLFCAYRWTNIGGRDSLYASTDGRITAWLGSLSY